jgi:hypothetical protein
VTLIIDCCCSQIDGFVIEFNNMKKMMMKNLKVWSDEECTYYYFIDFYTSSFTADHNAAGHGYGCSGPQPAHADPAGDGCPGEEGEEVEAHPGRGVGIR